MSRAWKAYLDVAVSAKSPTMRLISDPKSQASCLVLMSLRREERIKDFVQIVRRNVFRPSSMMEISHKLPCHVRS